MILIIQETAHDIYWVVAEGGGTDHDGGHSYTRSPLTKQGSFADAYNFAMTYAGNGDTEIRLDKRLCTV